MDQSAHEAHQQAADPHSGHKMSEVHENHDRHAGHSPVRGEVMKVNMEESCPRHLDTSFERRLDVI